MSTSLQGRPIRAALMLLALCSCALAFTANASAKHKPSERLVVRGEGVVGEGDCDAARCALETSGSLRGTLGGGAYAGAITLRLADAFANGEGGVCAPIHGRLVLGAGSPDRIVLALAGDSCQDGAGPPPAASFTGLADWAVVDGTGRYAHVRGHGTASFVEDAADRERMTLIGRIAS